VYKLHVDAAGAVTAFETLTAQGSRLGLMDAWSTPEQRQYNAAHTTCPSCQGQGYHVYKRSREVIREAVGCDTCLGTAAVRRTNQDVADRIKALLRRAENTDESALQQV
jgi:hypothetical protein